MNLKTSIILTMTFLLVVCTAWAGQPSSSQILRVYYFHRTHRCPSCLLLEELAKQTVLDNFETELKSGRIELVIINIDEPSHAHFEKDYALNSQSVVLSSIENGQEVSWKNLHHIWDYLEDENKLSIYIHEEIKTSIRESG